MRVQLLICVTTVLFTGCSSLPLCGSPEAKGKDCTHGFWATLANSNVTPQPSRNYLTNPVTLPPAPVNTQPNLGASPVDEYRTILVNTPNGLVYKRCRMLNGQAVACF